MNPRIRRLLVLLPLLLAAAGCGRVTTTQRLAGKWHGRPETAAERDRRQSPLALLSPEEERDRQAMRGESTDAVDQVTPTSDLESYQFEISLDLGADGTVRMSQGGGAPIEGLWRVLSSEGGEIGLQITALHAGALHADPQQPTREQRRFLAELIEDDRAMVLHEEGADPQFGVLRFERVEE